jgi:6-phosphogluconolactonase (cycloisomerase 2 family)
MSHRTLLPFSILLAASFLFLAGCGGSKGPTVCPLATNSGCGCATAIACKLPDYVFADGVNGQILAFPVDASTSVLGTPVTTSGPTTSVGMAALNTQYLYAGNATQVTGGASSVSAWTMDLTSGTLTPIAGSPFSLGPASTAAGIAIDNTSQTVYVADAGRIDAFTVLPLGPLSAVAGSPFPAGNNHYLAIDPQNRFLFAADDTPPGNILAYTIDNTSGALAPVPGSPFPAGASSPLMLGITVDASGKFVYAIAQPSNQVVAFSIASPSGALTPIPGSPFSTGNTPVAIAIANQFLYVANIGDGTTSGYRIDAATGLLSPLAGSPFPIPAGAMTVNAPGTFLYTAGQGGMMTLQIDANTGALTQVGSTISFSGATVLAYVQ